MKKNKMMRIASVLLVAVLLSTCAISGTFAKYTQDFTATATANVASWVVNVKDKDAQTFAFNLFNTITDSNGATEADVKAGFIAPGTKGSFTITVTNASQVNATYTTDISGFENLPITYTVTNGSNNLAMENGTADITVNWEWAFGGDTQTDLDLAGDTFTVTAKVTVTQVD